MGQRNAYMEAIGIIPYQHSKAVVKNHTIKDRKKWKRQRKMYGFDARETWSMDNVFAQWLYSHCKMFLSEAGRAVQLNCHKFIYKGKEYTQKEAVVKIIACTKYYLKYSYEDERKACKALQMAAELWSIILPAMWW